MSAVQHPPVSPYNLCSGTGLVCENHPNLAWAGAHDGACACDCGAGMDCAGCSAAGGCPIVLRRPIAIYAPKSAARIDKAADLIREAARLLDAAGDRAVLDEIEKVEGTDGITTDLADRLSALADRLDGEAA